MCGMYTSRHVGTLHDYLWPQVPQQPPLATGRWCRCSSYNNSSTAVLIVGAPLLLLLVPRHWRCRMCTCTCTMYEWTVRSSKYKTYVINFLSYLYRIFVVFEFSCITTSCLAINRYLVCMYSSMFMGDGPLAASLSLPRYPVATHV